MKRLIRTLSLQNSVTFGTKEEADDSAHRINKLHEVIKGEDEVSGGFYDALDHEQLLWVHACLQISSIYFYEKGASLKSTDCLKALAYLYDKQFRHLEANAWKIIYLESSKHHADRSSLDNIESLSSLEHQEAKLLATEIKNSWLVKNESPILDPMTKAPEFRSITLSNGNHYKGYIFRNKPHGYGMVKSNNGESYFGYFKNGRMHGPGQQFSSDGQIIFKGHWSKGKPLNE